MNVIRNIHSQNEADMNPQQIPPHFSPRTFYRTKMLGISYWLLLLIILIWSTASNAQDYLIYRDGTVRSGAVKRSPANHMTIIKEGNTTTRIEDGAIARIIYGNRRSPHGTSVSILRMDSTTVAGILIYADSTGIMIWKGSERYSPEDEAQFGIVVRPDEIRSASVKTNGDAGSGAVVGGFIGFGLGFLSNAYYSPDDAVGTGVLEGILGAGIGAAIGAVTGGKNHIAVNGQPSALARHLKRFNRNSLLKSPPLSWPSSTATGNPLASSTTRAL